MAAEPVGGPFWEPRDKLLECHTLHNFVLCVAFRLQPAQARVGELLTICDGLTNCIKRTFPQLLVTLQLQSHSFPDGVLEGRVIRQGTGQ